MQGFLMAAASAVILTAAFGLTRAPPDPTEVRADIDAFGSATFLVAQGDDWQEAWVVTCGLPLRDCVARSSGAILRLDQLGQPWLLVSTSGGGTLLLRDASVRDDAKDITAVLSRPITQTEVADLSRPGAELVLASSGGAERVLQVKGTAQVVDYLQWLASPTARGLRDARQWTTDGVVDLQELDQEQLKRYRVMKLRSKDQTGQSASL
jgi:hypothetical protein